MTFAFPEALYLFVVLAIIVLCRLSGRKEKGLEFSSLRPAKAAGNSLRQRFLWLPPSCEILAASAVILALARPQEGVEKIDRVTEGVAIEMVMDISSSMSISMRSFSGGSSRLEVAKEVFADFVEGDGSNLPGRPDDMLGLITFARYPNSVCPLTFSHDILLYFVRRLKIEDRPNEDGTAFGDALALAAARLQTVEKRFDRQKNSNSDAYRIRSKAIILLTDGDNNCGRHLPLEAAALARKWGIRVYTIGFGEYKAAASDEESSGDGEASRELSATEQTLSEIAEMTGGIFRRASGHTSLKSVYEEIGRLEKTRFVKEKYIDYKERYQLFVAAAIALYALAIVLSSTWLRKI